MAALSHSALMGAYSVARIPDDHIAYLRHLRDVEGFQPKVAYDIGSCMLAWRFEALVVWPKLKIYCIEANSYQTDFYPTMGIPESEFACEVVSDRDGREVQWWESPSSLTGNSYYREIGGRDPTLIYPDDCAVTRSSKTLDTIVAEKGWPKPDLVKIDVQGADVDVVRGGLATLTGVPHLLIELAHAEYNEGAPLREEATRELEALGFQAPDAPFDTRDVDADYDFIGVSA